MKALLVCFAGMSTSIMMKKMSEAATKNGIDLDIKAIPLSDLEDNLEEIDIVLLGPQVRYALSDVEKIVGDKAKVMVIETMDYGMMKGEKVLRYAIELVEGKQGTI